MAVSFDVDAAQDEKSGYKIDDADVEAVKVKGGSDAIAREANANIRILADRLQRGEMGAAEFYASMQREVKMLHMAQSALSRGGIDAMRPADWERVESIVARQFGGMKGEFPGLRAFAKDIASERYGKAGELSEGVLSRAGMYADAGRGTFHNTRMAVAQEKGDTLARRIKGVFDKCPECVAWAALGWIPIEEMRQNYPIGSGSCGAKCHCSIQTRKPKT